MPTQDPASPSSSSAERGTPQSDTAGQESHQPPATSHQPAEHHTPSPSSSSSLSGSPSSPSGGGADEGGGGGQNAPSRDQTQHPSNPVPPAEGRGDARSASDEQGGVSDEHGGVSNAGGPSGTAGTPPDTTLTVLILGSDHTDLGEIEISELSPNIAIGISRGRFPKGYPHVDPNEDAVFAATNETTTILVVADGHHGFDAARAAIQAISNATPQIIDADLETIVHDLATAAIKAVAETIPSLPPPRDTSRTALTICAIRHTTIATATIGDTSCLISARRRVKRIGSSDQFLSPDTDPQMIRVETTDLPPKATVVVSSDGFTNFAQDIDRSVRTASKQAPKDAVEALIAAAFAGGAGDNIAVGIAQSTV